MDFPTVVTRFNLYPQTFAMLSTPLLVVHYAHSARNTLAVALDALLDPGYARRLVGLDLLSAGCLVVLTAHSFAAQQQAAIGNRAKLQAVEHQVTHDLPP